MSKKSEYKQKNEAFLAAKRQEEGVKELAKGVLYEVQKSGNPQGRRPDLRSVVCVHYTGRLINGRVFDDSRREGIPAAFRLFEVIDGWQIALSQMRQATAGPSTFPQPSPMAVVRTATFLATLH